MHILTSSQNVGVTSSSSTVSGTGAHAAFGAILRRSLHQMLYVTVNSVSMITCEWYSTECALVSSHRTPSPPALIMNPVLVVANCRLRCHGRL